MPKVITYLSDSLYSSKNHISNKNFNEEPEIVKK